MTAAVYRSTPSLSIPQTQNTALVIEFNCLYTHDIRKKAKKWQDGFLRYHTFNKRIMVYDVPRNFIGDSHWTAGSELADGDEVMLDKAGVLVQVAESVGRTETDLTELRKSTKKGVTGSGHASSSSSPVRHAHAPATRATVFATPKPPTQLKHRSLNALLGTTKGPIGKAALPIKSPFEVRHNDVENDAWEKGGPPKRRRIDDRVGGTRDQITTVAKSMKSPELPLWARTVDAAVARKRTEQPLRKQNPSTEHVQGRSKDSDDPERFLPGFSSDALIPPSSPALVSTVAEEPEVEEIAAPPWKTVARSSSPAFQTQQAPSTVVTNAQRFEPSPPALSSSRRHGLETEPIRKVQAQPKPSNATMHRTETRRTTASDSRADDHQARPDSPPTVVSASLRPSSSKSGQTLRMTAGAPKKKTLLCQDQIVSAKMGSFSDEARGGANPNGGAAGDHDVRRAKTQKQMLAERLTRIRGKDTDKTTKHRLERRNSTPRAAMHAESENAGPESGAGAMSAWPTNKASKLTNVALSPQPQTRTLSRQRAAEELAELDRRIMPPAPPQPQPIPASKAPITSDVSLHPLQPGATRDRLDAVPTIPPASRRDVDQRSAATSTSPRSRIQALETSTSYPQVISTDTPSLPALDQADAPPPPVPRPADQQLRRAASEAQAESVAKPKRIPGAPMRLTPSPSKRFAPIQPAQTTRVAQVQAQEQPQQAACPKHRAKKPLQKAVSLNTAATGTSAVLLGRPFQVPKPPAAIKESEAEAQVADPWSREAFDLLIWRPPGWDEEAWCVKAT